MDSKNECDSEVEEANLYSATEASIRFSSDRRPWDLWKAPRSNNSSSPSKSPANRGTSSYQMKSNVIENYSDSRYDELRLIAFTFLTSFNKASDCIQLVSLVNKSGRSVLLLNA